MQSLNYTFFIIHKTSGGSEVQQTKNEACLSVFRLQLTHYKDLCELLSKSIFYLKIIVLTQLTEIKAVHSTLFQGCSGTRRVLTVRHQRAGRSLMQLNCCYQVCCKSIRRANGYLKQIIMGFFEFQRCKEASPFLCKIMYLSPRRTMMSTIKSNKYYIHKIL